MTYDEIFEAYYNLYRLEAETPASTDDEYKIGLRLANEAINRWAGYDGTYWKELYKTLKTADDGAKTVTASLTYDAPSDMKEAGGFVRLTDILGNTVRRYRIAPPEDVQFLSDDGTYCYFTGNPSQGFVLHLNPVPDTSVLGSKIDYVYYKKPTKFTSGGDTTEMSDPYFIVNRMLAQRFRGSRNPYYASAKADAEDILKTMQMDNNSGTWANPWKLPDRSGTSWGV